MICILSLLCLAGCQEKAGNIDTIDVKSGKEEGKTEMLRLNDSKDGVLLDDLLDSLEMLGKTTEDTGIPIEALNMEINPIIKTYIDGNIFGTEDYGILYFDKTDDGERLVVESIWIHIKNMSYADCKHQLTEKIRRYN